MEKLLKEFMDEMRDFRKETRQRFDQQDARFNNIEHTLSTHNERFDSIEHTLSTHNEKFDSIEHTLSTHNEKLNVLTEGQDEIKNLLKHNTMLLTENITNLRQDIRISNTDTKTDVNLLFKEVEGVKRKVSKIENKLGL